ncbi:MAG: 23S rRNA (pseudouridine(1915)-N(3))-methyltransferase RlmH [Proteobacteria bacterium]|nr:23S rRNA (pseudouridine(1915)-N(3))-methyltransferase RlmH [Pseudomonadota bacterium]
MRLAIAAIGRLKSGLERDMAARYRERAEKAGRNVALRPLDIVEIRESRAAHVQQRLVEEAGALTATVPDGAIMIALDERGENIASVALARCLEGWRDSGRTATFFLVGGADGLEQSVIRSADLRLAFGATTWPHQLVRIMLLEQVYRAVTILSGHPYHRA